MDDVFKMIDTPETRSSNHPDPEPSPRQRRAVKGHLKTVIAIRKRFHHLPREIQRHVALKLGLECGLLIQEPQDLPEERTL